MIPMVIIFDYNPDLGQQIEITVVATDICIEIIVLKSNLSFS